MKVGIGTTDISRFNFFNGVSFQIGPDVLSFQDLENGVLRANRKPPFALSAQFGSKDSRQRLSMSSVDCRIHFALNCGANSCPPVKDYTAEGIEDELRIVAQAFCEDDSHVRVVEAEGAVYLSSIFKWYREDFATSNSELPKAVLRFLRGAKKSALERMISNRGTVKVHFNTYDWSTNASDFEPFSGGNVKANTSRFL